MPYTRRPYVQPAYEPGNLRLGDLMRSRGRSLADAELRSGDIAAQMWANLGNTIAGTVGGIMREREDAPVRQMERENVTLKNQALKQEAQQGATARQIQGQALRQSEDGTWTYDRDYLAREFQAAGIADRLPGVLEGLDAFDKSARSVQQAKQEGLAGLAFGVTQLGNTAAAFNQAIELAVKNGFITRKEVGPILQRVGDDPRKIGEVVTALASSSPTFAAKLAPKPQEAFTLSPGQQRFGPDGQPIASVPVTPPQQSGFNLSPGQTRFGPDGKPIASLPAAPQAPASPSFQAKEVLNDEGKPVMANFDARTGRYIDPNGQPIKNPRPVPSAAETQDARKFQQADPILKAVEELSERINTQQGAIATISGAAERAKAQVNLNDDVAEYEALVSGFTPLVARALGHIGILTQQDVDSVKALFPRPGDSKSLRDRKIKRIKSIIGTLEQNANPASAPGQTQTPPPSSGGVPTYQDYLRMRQGPGPR